MKKCFGIIMVAVFAVALIAGGAWAQSEMDIAAVGEGCSNVDGDIDADPSGPFVVGDEWLATKGTTVLDVDLGDALKRPCGPYINRSDILYKPECDISFNTLIEVTVANGGIFPNANYALVDCEERTKVADLVDFRIDYGTGGYSKMYFEFDFSQEEYGEVIVAGTVLTMLEDIGLPIAGNRPVLLYTNGQLRSGDMTIQVTGAWDDAIGAIECPKTPDAEVLVKIFGHEQLTARVEYRNGEDCDTLIGPATSTIDVFADPTRGKFLDEGYDSFDTGPVNSVAEILVIDAGENGDTLVDGVEWGDVNEGMCLTDSGTSYDLTLNGNQDAIIQGIPDGCYDGVKLDGANLYKTTGQWTIGSNFNLHDLRDCEENDLLITVDGTTVIQTAVYSVDLVVYSDESSNLTLLSDDTAFVWDVNAIEIRVPYVLIETGGEVYRSFIEITNRATHEAEVWLDAVISYEDCYSNPNVFETPNTPIKTVPGTSVCVITEDDLDDYLVNVDDQRIYRCGLTLFVAVDKDKADASGYQKENNGNGTSRTVIPVLYNTGNPLDKGRTWQ